MSNSETDGSWFNLFGGSVLTLLEYEDTAEFDNDSLDSLGKLSEEFDALGVSIMGMRCSDELLEGEFLPLAELYPSGVKSFSFLSLTIFGNGYC